MFEKGGRERRVYSLAIEAVGETSMSRDGITEILDIESALESTRKESSERRNKTRERSHDERMELERRVRHRGDLFPACEGGEHR